MRLRTTAAVFAGALALVLPTAGPSLADDHGGRSLGTLHYRFVDQDGEDRSGQIRPAENDTCYVLTRTSEEEPAVEVVNETKSLAELYDNRSCDGKAKRTLRPGERARHVEAVSVFFKPVVEDGASRPDEGRGDWTGRDDEGRGEQGRDDQGRDDQGRGEQGRDDQGRGDHGRDDHGRDDQGRGDQGRDDQGRGDHGRDDQGRGEQGRDEQGRPDNGGREDQVAAPDNGGREDQVAAPDNGGREDQAVAPDNGGRPDGAMGDEEEEEEPEEDIFNVIFRAIP
ncbi:hypothetical protein ACGFYU_24640 [Streptomyces sp. NPDC048337]|uniref:hypothetical protein n=1 Tax=Streptomyces sp. NPDC048337 TaxID=3365535 RepID=UPI00370FF82F